ncbi:hypothetical protein GGR57DRAFT_510704 [Xylariaceae sp. FL1272]|nr:hypothetical protein GGR57DRAFT_510704 [Xylariaceae sp. FL1272]
MLSELGFFEKSHDTLGRSTPSTSQYSTTTTLEPEFALNFVEAWDSTPVLISILTPTIISLAICITWPIVAVHNFEADIQASVQTSASMASYFVTASPSLMVFKRAFTDVYSSVGALIIALLAWYETLVKENVPEAFERPAAATSRSNWSWDRSARRYSRSSWFFDRSLSLSHPGSMNRAHEAAQPRGPRRAATV